MTKQANRTQSGLILPTDAEDAAINRGIAADPDTVEITAERTAKLQPLRGSPPLEQPKAPACVSAAAPSPYTTPLEQHTPMMAGRFLL